MTSRGRLRILLGAAPGSGKTYAMLREGLERRHQGEDVVVGFVEAHGRPRTVAALGSLEVVPRLEIDYRGRAMQDMDVDAVVMRSPQVALVDELAHTNVPGMRNGKRWQDVDELRERGIDVITTLNVQHLESVKDLVEHIVGVPVRETVPDRILDEADEVQFIDISPEALRKRMRHGNIYPATKVDAALANFFRPGNLAALREIALRIVGHSAGASRGVAPEPEDVLVAVSGRPSSEALIRRGGRLARTTGAICTVVTVVPARRIPPGDGHWRAVAEQVGAHVVDRRGRTVATAIEAATREFAARHLVIGESSPGAGPSRFRPTVADRLIGRVRDVDVHVLARHVRQRTPTAGGQDEARPDPEALLRRIRSDPGRPGGLRLYLGYARGCGTTTAMLDEARRRSTRGSDVVVAALSSGPRGPAAAPGGLELLGGPDGPAARGILDVDALLARNPQVAFVDGIAGLDNRGQPRVEVLVRLLEAGVSVVGTLLLTDLASSAPLREATGTATADTDLVDDRVLALADELELVDITPSLLEERLRRGDVVPLAGVAHALQTEYDPGLLAAQRESAFRVIADHTDRRLVAYMRERGIDQPWEVRPRVLACVPPRPHMERLIERTASLAGVRDGEFRVLTVRTRRRTDEEQQLLGGYIALAHRLGGTFVTVSGASVTREIAGYAQRTLVTEIVMGRGRRRRLGTSTASQLVRVMTDVDIHVLADPDA